MTNNAIYKHKKASDSRYVTIYFSTQMLNVFC